MDRGTVLYFAYGSNMKRERLEKRIGPVEDLGAARLDGWQWAINKFGRDGTAKGNISPHPESTVWGVVYRLTSQQIARLDVGEEGYERIQLPIRANGQSEAVTMEVYLSQILTDDHRVAPHYRAWMAEGAREHGLPGDVVAALENLPTTDDPEA